MVKSQAAPVGVILAGGRGSRLGGEKATVQLGGRPLISYPLAAMKAAVGEAVVLAKPMTRLPALEGVRVAFEPEEDICRLLEESARPYQGDRLRIRVIPSFVGSGSREGVTALDRVSWQLGDPGSRQGVLIKIDVEGAEEDVLDGAASFIRPGNLFLIEAHREEFLTTIPARFAARGLRLRRIDQQPLRLLGRELRSENNWWLVSELA